MAKRGTEGAQGGGARSPQGASSSLVSHPAGTSQRDPLEVCDGAFGHPWFKTILSTTEVQGEIHFVYIRAFASKCVCTGPLCRRGHAHYARKCSSANRLEYVQTALPVAITTRYPPCATPFPPPPPTAGFARIRRAPEGFPAERSPGGGAQFRVEGFRGGFRG